MNFTCTYCGRSIEGISVVIDNTHFAHIECKKEALNLVKLEKKMDNIREMDKFYNKNLANAIGIKENE